jgi:hypothetical protein
MWKQTNKLGFKINDLALMQFDALNDLALNLQFDNKKTIECHTRTFFSGDTVSILASGSGSLQEYSNQS